MKHSTMSMDFAVEIIEPVKFLMSKHEIVIANQIGRSGTSIGANIHEANYAQGKTQKANEWFLIIWKRRTIF